MKRNTYTYRPSPTSPRGIRWKLILLAVVLVLALPKAIMMFSQSSFSLQAPGLALVKVLSVDASSPSVIQVDHQSQQTMDEKSGDMSAAELDEECADNEATPEDILERVVRVGRGDTLMGLLLASGLAQAEAHAAVCALQDVYNPRDLRPGHELVLTFRTGSEDLEEEFFEGLKMQVDVNRNVLVQREGNEQFAAMEERWELQHVPAAAQGRIDTSLYEAAVNSGLPVPVLMQMIRAYSFDVDFQRDIHPGDTFEVLFERQVDLEGLPVREGPLLYATLQTRGRSLRIYRYTSLDGETDFYNERGQSVRKTLMLTPIDGARLSSGYGMRRHPILGYSRMHKGLDFAAPSGTPIMAAGDGVVVEAGRKGNYGNAVVLRHPNEYRTLYGHMRRFARGIKPGARVKQGEVIGYVGTTGMSTGPHLHYEVLHRGKHVNPASVVSPPGRTLAGNDLELFRRVTPELEGQYAALAGKKLAQAPEDDHARTIHLD